MKNISLNDFLSYFPIQVSSPEFQEYFNKVNTNYSEPSKEDLESYLIEFVKKVTKKSAFRTVEENKAIFEAGWSVHIEKWQKEQTLESLKPLYLSKASSFLMGADNKIKVVQNRSLSGEMQILICKYIALAYLKDFQRIHEFGAGSGLNLLTIAQTLPSKEIIGYEWTDAGTKVANLIGELSEYNVKGYNFDLFTPNYEVECCGDGVLVFGVIEQLNDNYQNFLDFLLIKKPGLVINIELEGCGHEEKNAYEELANVYLQMRHYSEKYTNTLKELEKDNKIKILDSFLLPFMTSFCMLRCTIWYPI